MVIPSLNEFVKAWEHIHNVSIVSLSGYKTSFPSSSLKTVTYDEETDEYTSLHNLSIRVLMDTTSSDIG